MNKKTGIGLAGIVAMAALLATGCGRSEPPAYVVKGNLALSYMIQKTPTEAEGGNGIAANDYKPREIRCYQNYILVITRHQSGEVTGAVYPVDRIRNFNWLEKP